jgi:hypothetical protein
VRDIDLFREIVDRAARWTGEAGMSGGIRCDEVPHEAGVGLRIVHVLDISGQWREYPSVVLVFDEEGRLAHSYGCEPQAAC